MPGNNLHETHNKCQLTNISLIYLGNYMPYKIFCVVVCTTHCVDQIQASLKNYSECLYIIDLVSVKISILTGK